MLKRKYDYLDVDLKKWGGAETLFPGWNAADERVCVYSPHDDDAILGAGYLMATRIAFAEAAKDPLVGKTWPEWKQGHFQLHAIYMRYVMRVNPAKTAVDYRVPRNRTWARMSSLTCRRAAKPIRSILSRPVTSR